MLRSLIRGVLELRFLVVVIVAALIFFGIAQIRAMPVDVLPEFSLPYVEIQTEALGLSAQEVEQLITVPMEQDLLNGTPWLETIRSESVPGLSSIVLFFQPGTDLIRARQMVQERLSQAFALPHVSKPPTMLQPLSSTSRVMIIGLSSKTLSLIQMSVLARWTIAPRLMGVPGVANVATWGQRDRQLQIQIDPQRLQDNKVSVQQVLETSGNALWVSSLSFVEASTPGTGGFIDTSNQRLGIRHILPIVSPEGLAQVPIEDTSLKLGDVANVVEDHQPLIGDALGSQGPSLLLVVDKFPGANTRDVTRGVEKALNDMRPGLAGMEIDSSLFRPADFIDMTMNNLAVALLIGFIVVGITLAIFFFEWRTVLISLIAIPVSLMAGGLVLYLRGATINTMMVAGLVIAASVLIDDAIVDVENIMRRLRKYRKEGNAKSTASIIVEGLVEVRNPVFYAVLILLVTVSPIFFIGGQSGIFFQSLVVSYGLAVVASTVVALTVTPALCLILLANAPLERRESPLVAWLRPRYESVLARIIQRPRPMFVAVCVVTVVGLVALPFLSQSLVPTFKELNLLIHVDGAPGTSQPEMSRISGLISRELQTIPGVRSVAVQVGRAVQGDRVVNVSSADLWLSIDPSANYDKTTATIQKTIEGYPGIHFDVQTYLREKSSDVIPEPADSVVVRVFGNTTDVLRNKAEEVKKAIGGINGVTEIHVNLPIQQPNLEIEVDLAAAQRYGLKPGDVRRVVATLLSGIQVGNLFEEQKVFDVVVWSTPETRHSLSSVRDLMIDTPDGKYVRLGDVAQVRIVPTDSVIRHEDVRRYIDVVAEVQGRDLGAVATDISNRLSHIEFPLEYHAEVLGDYATQQVALTRLLTLAIAATIGVFFLLQAAYRSWRLAFLSFLTLPSALVGALIVALVTGKVVSLGTLAGLLVVFGIAVRNQILLIDHYRHLAKSEGESFGTGLAIRGARERFVPTLTATLATGLAMLAMLLLGDIPGLEVVRPMAVTVLGGLVTSTLLNLFILPALYLRLKVVSIPEIDISPGIGLAEQGTLGGVVEAPAAVAGGAN